MKKIRYIYVTYRNPMLRAIRGLLPKFMRLGLVWAGAPRRIVDVPVDTVYRTKCARVLPLRIVDVVVFKVKIGRK